MTRNRDRFRTNNLQELNRTREEQRRRRSVMVTSGLTDIIDVSERSHTINADIDFTNDTEVWLEEQDLKSSITKETLHKDDILKILIKDINPIIIGDTEAIELCEEF